MTWAGSAMFNAYVRHCIVGDPVVRATWGSAAASRFFIAAFHSTVTPDRDAPEAETLYGTGVWTPDQELTGGTWPPGGVEGHVTGTSVAGTGGVALNMPLITATSVLIDDLAGDLFYYRNPANPAGHLHGLGFHDYGGSLDVAGTLTVTWPYPPGAVCLNYSS